MIWYYIEKNLQNFTMKYLEMIDSLSKMTGYKIHLQKALVFLYTNNMLRKILWEHHDSQ